MNSSISVKSLCSNLLRKSVFASYGIATASATLFAYLLVICSPWVMNLLREFGRFLRAHQLNVDVLLPAALCLLSFPLAFFTGRALITFGSRMMRSSQAELATSMTVTGSIVWLCWAALNCSWGHSGEPMQLLTQLTLANVVMDSLIFIVGMITATKKLRNGQTATTNELAGQQTGTGLVAAQ